MKLAKSLGITRVSLHTREELLTKMYDAQVHYSKVKKEAPTHQGKWLADLATARIEAGLEIGKCITTDGSKSKGT